jgi:outer membrane protein OmpA-like peptidoglycan-associated protein
MKLIKEINMRLSLLNSLCLALSLSLLTAACSTTNPYTGERQTSKAAIGAGIGAAGGAVAGGLIGGGDWRKRALLGAGIGAVAGGSVGYYMDVQEAKLRDQLQGTGVSVTRQGDSILLNMPGNVTFDVNSAAIRPEFFEVLNSVALVINEYNQTYVDVLGHTDSTGSDAYNMQLSQQRAESVAAYLRAQGIMHERLLIQGFGKTRPIAPNDTAEGRALNRRVEIRLSPLTA